MPIITAPSPVRRYLDSRQNNQAIGKAVLTSSGVIRGHTAPTDNDVSEYLGIPYAQPPVDALRWMPPVKYSGVQVINATNFVCTTSPHAF
jgi:carboxylesterase type B